MVGPLTQLILTLVGLEVAILVVLRPLVWWYFGISRAVRALESIDASLRCLPAVRDRNSRLRRAG